MKVIPVIDYLQGSVVSAELGNRDHYSPITSRICPSSDITDVLTSILSVHTFNTIYIADLDCIHNNQIDKALWPDICSQYPHIEFWLDIGKFTSYWRQILQQTTNVRPVVGSESFSSINDLSDVLTSLQSFNPLLSIDVKNNIVLGPDNLLTTFTHWPQEIIVLPLHQVGSSNGPDSALIEKIRKIIPNQLLYYGGGIRDINDLIALSKLKLSGALISKSLHNGKISKSDLLANNM